MCIWYGGFYQCSYFLFCENVHASRPCEINIVCDYIRLNPLRGPLYAYQKSATWTETLCSENTVWLKNCPGRTSQEMNIHTKRWISTSQCQSPALCDLVIFTREDSTAPSCDGYMEPCKSLESMEYDSSVCAGALQTEAETRKTHDRREQATPQRNLPLRTSFRKQ